MKMYVWLFLFSACHVSGYSNRKRPTASFYFITLTDSTSDFKYYSWKINGKAVPAKQDTLVIPIHFPDFDTITLTYKSYVRTIITRFERGHTYELIHEGWYNNIQVNDKVKEPRKTARTREAGKLTLKVIFTCRNLPQDTLMAGTFGTIRWNFTNGKIFQAGKASVIEEPVYNTIPNSCFPIRIGHGSIRREIDTYYDSRFLNFSKDEEHVFVFDEELIAFEYKFFDKKTLYIDYDGKSRDYKLTLK